MNCELLRTNISEVTSTSGYTTNTLPTHRIITDESNVRAKSRNLV